MGVPGRKVSVGERLVVAGRPEKAVVSRVEPCRDRCSDRIVLDWGALGASQVWADEEGRTWVRWLDLN